MTTEHDFVFPELPAFGPSMLHDLVWKLDSNAEAEMRRGRVEWARFWRHEAEWWRRELLGEGRA